MTHPKPLTQYTVQSRKINNIDKAKFKEDILSSSLCKYPSSDLTTLTDQYNTVVAATLDDHASVTKKRVAIKPNYPWLNEDFRSDKRKRRKFEQKWRKTGLIVHQEIFVEQRQLVSNLMKYLKTKYYADKIEECGTDQKPLFNVINSLQNKRRAIALPSSGSISELPDIFNKFFTTKISQIRHKLDSDSCTDISFTGISDSKCSNISLDTFRPAAEEEVFKIISKSPKKSCALDPIPAGFLIDILPTLLLTITKIITISLETGTVPSPMEKNNT